MCLPVPQNKLNRIQKEQIQNFPYLSHTNAPSLQISSCLYQHQEKLWKLVSLPNSYPSIFVFVVVVAKLNHLVLIPNFSPYAVSIPSHYSLQVGSTRNRTDICRIHLDLGSTNFAYDTSWSTFRWLYAFWHNIMLQSNLSNNFVALLTICSGWRHHLACVSK